MFRLNNKEVGSFGAFVRFISEFTGNKNPPRYNHDKCAFEYKATEQPRIAYITHVSGRAFRVADVYTKGCLVLTYFNEVEVYGSIYNLANKYPSCMLCSDYTGIPAQAGQSL